MLTLDSKMARPAEGGRPGAEAAVVEQRRAYWRQQLAGCVPVLQLPYDRPRSLEPSGAAATLCKKLGVELMRQAGDAAAALGVPLDALLLAAVQVRAAA